MIPRRPAPRRGIALLLVLATLVLSTSRGGRARPGRRRARLAATVRHHAELADQIRDAAEAPIQGWLHRHAGRLVLPPDADAPRFLVLDDAFELGGEPARITISAFDQCGMPPTTARSAATDALLPAGLAAALDRLGEAYAEQPGARPARGRRRGACVPHGRGSDPIAGRARRHPQPPAPGRSRRREHQHRPAAPDRVGLPRPGPGRPRRGHRVAIRRPRRLAGGGCGPRATSPPETTPLPVAMSTAWAFRVDCRVGGVLRSWWCVYADAGSNWERVQRIAITD